MSCDDLDLSNVVLIINKDTLLFIFVKLINKLSTKQYNTVEQAKENRQEKDKSSQYGSLGGGCTHCTRDV